MGKYSRSFQPRQSNQRREVTREGRAPAFSYRANRLPSDQNQGARSTKVNKKSAPGIKWQQIPSILMSIALVASIGYVLSLSSSPKVVVRNAASDPGSVFLRERAIYEEASQKVLESSILNRSKVTIDTAGFDRKMREKFPELSVASVTLPLMGRRPIVELVVVKPAMILSIKNDKTYILDEDGRAIIPVNEAKGIGSLQLPVVADESGDSFKAGEGVLTKQSVTFITTFVNQLSARKVKVSTITLPPLASEVQFKVDGQQYYIKASLMTDARQAAGSYLAMKAKLESDKVTPAEYIDVRVDEKVFYK